MAEADRRKWDARYQGQALGSWEPSPFLRSLEGLVPRRGRALDVAGGTGGNALWLARCGLDTTLADISSVALEIARNEAIARGIDLQTLAIDLELEPFPTGPWDVIVCVNFLWRPLLENASAALAPEGLLIVSHPTRKNLERHSRPGAEFLLEEGELRALARGLKIVSFEEDWHAEGRHEARLVARRRTAEQE